MLFYEHRDFDNEMRHTNHTLSDDRLAKLREKNLVRWCRTKVLERNTSISPQLKELILGPSRVVTSYQGYFVNGYKFHTEEKGKDMKTQNYGVCVRGSCYDDCEYDYYGVIEEIIQLHYTDFNLVTLFKCRWFDYKKGTVIHPKYGIVDVNHQSRISAYEPFILASQAQQVYYSSYPIGRENWWAVCKTRARRMYPAAAYLGLDGNENNIFEGVYQEDEVSEPILIDIDTDLDNADILYGGGEEDEEVETTVLLAQNQSFSKKKRVINEDEELEEDDDEEDDYDDECDSSEDSEQEDFDEDRDCDIN